MMKKKISWLSFMAVFFILFSCRNEQEALNESSTNRNRDIISFAAFQKETQIQKVGEVISPLSISQKNNQNDDPLSGFLIDTETINRIKANGDISTYAFRIYSLFGNPHDVYNMVYRKRNDGTLHYSIIRIKGNTPYVLYDSEAASSAQKHAAKNSTAKTSSHEDCAASYSVSIWHCKNGHSWETCDKCPECVETLTVCVGSGGGDNSGGFGGPSNGNPSSPPPPVDPITEGGSAAYLTDPSGYVFDPNLPPSTDAGYVRALRAYLFWEQIPGALYRQWASGNAGIYHNLIENYLNSYSTGDNSNNINFTNWAIDFLMQNPDTTWQQFQNWFMGESEGKDGEDYDAAYWDDPNLAFPAQNLPSWQNYYNAFPKDSNGNGIPGPDIYNLVGGVPKGMRDGVLSDSNPNNDRDYDNACALRVSRALNYSGVIIPNLPNQTFKGADGKYYFLSAKKLNAWMRKTFGTNPATQNTPFNPKHIHITGAQAGVNGVNLPNLLAGKKGIYSLVSSNSNWASGHGDILLPNTTCINGCHFFDAPIAYIDVWILQ